ncbi:MAG: protein-disulfide reductase DsbD domain-containing protein [Pyrinomonadaceae bacterium]
MKQLLLTSTMFAALVLMFGAYSAAYSQTVNGTIGGGSVSRGKAAKASIVINIPRGLHINSNNPKSEYAIPTTVRLSGPGIRVSGLRYPRGKNRKFQFSENEINVYDGRVSFPFTVTVPENFRGTTVKVHANVRFQPCTDEVCYSPRTKEITVTARVR